MTTRVTVTASGANYPARVVKISGSGQPPTDQLVASGESLDVFVGTNDTVVITEPYHPKGYPAPAEEE